MGYSTDFKGEFLFDRQLTMAHFATLRKLADGDAKEGPGGYCQWTPNDDGTALSWDGGEKFYNYIEWLKYIVATFLVPWGYILNGEVMWQGEEIGDVGKIVVKKNGVTAKKLKVDLIECPECGHKWKP